MIGTEAGSISSASRRSLSLLLGDFVQNLRASLDHSIYALSTSTGKDSLRIEYPINVKEHQYIEAREVALEGLPDEYRAIVDASQPYHRGKVEAAKKDPLAVLAWLSNVDKHRLIHPAFHRQRGRAKVTVLKGRLSDIQIRRDIPLDQPVSEGTVVSAARPKPGLKPEDVDMETYVEFTVAFSERALDYVALENMWDYISRVINTLRAVSEGEKPLSTPDGPSVAPTASSRSCGTLPGRPSGGAIEIEPLPVAPPERVDVLERDLPRAGRVGEPWTRA